MFQTVEIETQSGQESLTLLHGKRTTRRSRRVEAGFMVKRSLDCVCSLITRKLMASAGTR
jgi:hypothetical protein